MGVRSRNLYQGTDLNDVPFMLKEGGQTFAQAYTSIYDALSTGKTPAAQPFFESALRNSSYCTGFSSCTAAVVSNENSNIMSQYVTNMWQDLEGSWNFTNAGGGPTSTSLLSSLQCTICYGEASSGYSNYNAMVVTVQKRMSSGLTLNANFTYGRSLGTLALNQSYVENNLNDVLEPAHRLWSSVLGSEICLQPAGNLQSPARKGSALGQ